MFQSFGTNAGRSNAATNTISPISTLPVTPASNAVARKAASPHKAAIRSGASWPATNAVTTTELNITRSPGATKTQSVRGSDPNMRSISMPCIATKNPTVWTKSPASTATIRRKIAMLGVSMLIHHCFSPRRSPVLHQPGNVAMGPARRLARRGYRPQTCRSRTGFLAELVWAICVAQRTSDWPVDSAIEVAAWRVEPESAVAEQVAVLLGCVCVDAFTDCGPVRDVNPDFVRHAS